MRLPRGKKKWLVYGAVAAALYYAWKQKQLNAVAAGAAAAAASGANAPNSSVAPTGATTTQNMQALAYADTGSLPGYGVNGIISPGFHAKAQREIDMRRAAAIAGLTDYPGTVRSVGGDRTLMF